MSRYVLLQRIGDGGMAEVFRARGEGPDGFAQTCAVKRLLPELRKDSRLQARFIDEARISGRLRHPAIVSVLDFYEDEGVRHLVLELVDGASVEDLIAASATGLFVPVSIATLIVLEAARALQYAHSQEVLHRDVSACNILLSINGAVKLADFGLADAVGRLSQTEPGSIAGKVAYMSPSRQRGSPAVEGDDAWALGVVLERLLAAADPRDRASAAGRKLQRIRAQLSEAEAKVDWAEFVNALRRADPATPEEAGALVRQAVERKGRAAGAQ